MKRLNTIIAFGLLAVLPAFGIITLHTNTVHLKLADVCDGTFQDFKFRLAGYDDQVFVFTYDQTFSGIAASFRITKPIEGTIYLDVPITDVTVSGTSITFSVARTNIPPPGTYYGELLTYESSSTNYYRSVAQGTLPVTWSLYLNETNYFNRSTTNAGTGQVYVHPSWIDPPWISSTSVLAASYVSLTAYNANNILQGNTNTVFRNYDTAQTATNAAIDVRLSAEEAATTAQAATNALKTDLTTFNATNILLQAQAAYGISAYGWGDHSLAGYLSTGTNLFDSVRVGSESRTTTNLCTLTSTYTGVVATAGIAYTGTVDVTDGSLYMVGYEKQNAFGSVTMSVAGLTLHSTASGANSNYFAAMGTATTNVIVAIYGNGASKSDVSNVYVTMMTGGHAYVSGDLYVGDNIYGADNLVLTNDTVYLAAITNNTLTEATSNSYAKVGRVGQFTTRTNYQTVGDYLTNEPLFIASAAYDITASDTTLWHQASADGISATTDVAALQASTNDINTRVTANAGYTNYAFIAWGWGNWATNYLNWLMMTNTPVTAAGYGMTDVYTKVESDATYATTGTVGTLDTDFSAHTNNESADIQHLTAAEKAHAAAAITNETDPVWEAEKSGYATGTPLYVYSETDPVWESEKGGYATGTPLYVESYVGTITGGTMTAGSANTFVVTGPNAAATWNTNDAAGGAGSGFPLDADGDLAGYSLTNGFFVGDGDGLTNLTGYVGTNDPDYTGVLTNLLSFHGESGVVMRIATTNVYFGAPDLATKTTVTAVSNAFGTADTIVSNAFGAADTVVSNAFGAADTVVSNAFVAADLVVSNAYTNTAVLAAAALPASETNALAVTDLQITGTSPTNGAVWVATDTVGQGGWKVLSKFSVTTTDDQSFPTAGYTLITWNVTNFNVGSKFIDNSWIPGRAGYVQLFVNIALTKAVGGRYVLVIRRDGVTITQSEVHIGDGCSAAGEAHPLATVLDYCPTATNSYAALIYTTIATTNWSGGNTAARFEGTEIP